MWRGTAPDPDLPPLEHRPPNLELALTPLLAPTVPLFQSFRGRSQLNYMTPPTSTNIKRTQELCKPSRLAVVLDGNEDRVQEDENDHQPVERLTLDQPTYSKPENTHSDQTHPSELEWFNCLLPLQ